MKSNDLRKQDILHFKGGKESSEKEKIFIMKAHLSTFAVRIGSKAQSASDRRRVHIIVKDVKDEQNHWFDFSNSLQCQTRHGNQRDED